MNKKGFSLLELSIVLVISGFSLYGALTVYTSTAEQAKITATTTKLDALEKALKLYYKINGDLPCPADGEDTLDDAAFGAGAESNDGAIPAHSCANDNLNLTAASGGVVPTRTLDLPDSYMFDSWGNRITYVVSDVCANTGTWTDGVPNSGTTDCENAANLTVKDNTGSFEDRTTKAAYVLISHGKNGVGAWRRNGGSRAPSVATTSAHELENAQINTAGVTTSADNIYRDDFIKDWTGAGAEYFDDIVRWKTQPQVAYVE